MNTIKMPMYGFDTVLRECSSFIEKILNIRLSIEYKLLD